MAAEDVDDFGEFTDFKSTFPADSNGLPNITSTATFHGDEGNNQNGTEKMDFFASFPTSGIQASCPTDLSFNAFENCPIDVSTGEVMPEFSSFVGDVNIADLPIPNPGELDISNFSITPLPLDHDPSTGNDSAANFTAFHNSTLPNFNFSTNPPLTGDPQTSVTTDSRNKQSMDNSESAFGDFESFALQDPSLNSDTGMPLQIPIPGFHSSDPASTKMDSTAEDRSHQKEADGQGFANFASFSAFPTATITSQPVPAAPQDRSPYIVAMVPTSPPPLDDFGDFGGFEMDGAVTEDKTEKHDRSGSTSDKRTDSSLLRKTEQTALSSTPSEKKGDDNLEGFKRTEDAKENIKVDSAAGSIPMQVSMPLVEENRSHVASEDGEFGEFSGSAKDNFVVLEATCKTDDIGAFSNSENDAFASANTADDFGAFTDSTKDNFGAFSDSTKDDFGAFSDSKKDDFGAFSDSKKDDFGAFSDTKKDDFGTFSDSKNDFGDFSSSADTAFGSFPTTTTPSKPVKPLSQTSTAMTTQLAAKDVSKVCGDVLMSCFPSGAARSKSHDNSQLSASLLQQLLATQLTSEHTDQQEQSAWQSLQKCIDFTVPLYKWGQSYLQEHYYGAIQIDPLLVTKPGGLPFHTSGLFEAPLGGATAAEDLMEAFGFEGGLEAASRDPSTPKASGEFKLNSDSAPALLDLSLPNSPATTDNNDAFTLDSDLLSLDLNPQSNTQQLTSKQQLVLNERLVVSRSTWMDSELLKLGDAGSERPQQPSTSPPPPTSPKSSSPSSLLGKRQNSVEQQLLQLGLDATKTTLAAARTAKQESTELSLSARSVLGRLPDLSFMLSESLVQSHYSGSM